MARIVFDQVFASLALKGLAIGLSISAPIGPVGVLCIRRTLTFGRTFGFATGLGVATADVICGCVTGFGMNSIAGLLIRERPSLDCVGGLLVCFLGVGIFVRPPVTANSVEPAQASLFSAYFSALFLTIINPMTLLSIVAIFAGLGVGVTTDWLETTLFIVGIALGAILWWYLLSWAVRKYCGNITAGWMKIINRVSGLAILALGVHLVVSSLK